MNPHAVWIFWLVGSLLSLLLLLFALRAGRRLRLLIDTPTSKAKGVFVGQVEIAGSAVLDPPIRSFLAETECVWFHYDIEEEWARWVTETYRDSKGNTCTRTVRKTGWQTVAEGGETPAFFVQDDTGAVLVRPVGASIDATTVCSETVRRGEPLYFRKGPAGEIADSTGIRRFREQAIPNRAALFVAGRAHERADVVAPEIAADKEQDMFLISCRGEGRVQRGYRWQFWILSGLALVPLPLAVFIAAHQRAIPVDWRVLSGLAAGVAGVWWLAWLWMTFNSLVHLRNRVAQAWSLVDVQLKRRSDLIPRLVDVVTGLRDHERRVQVELAALRTQSEATPSWQPGPDVAAAQPTLLAVAERYPELKTDEGFRRLQRELADTETRVALARDYYNEIATHHNTRLEIVPDRWIAPVAGLHPRPLLGAESFERATVTVNLG